MEYCRLALSGEPEENYIGKSLILSPSDAPKAKRNSVPRKIAVHTPHTISDDTLNHLAKSAWSASPWVFAVLAIAVFLIAVMLIPRKQDSVVDRNTAPVNYLVLSWDETGKYGSRPRARSGEENPIQFRIPYGVYSVLNNNSIPVELYLFSDSDEASAVSPHSEGLSAAEADEAAEAEDQNNRVILRPNSSRQITVDTDQYMTLSEDAKDLIFFYLSEVPDEPESDTTGQVRPGQSVIFAYIKGTEVRFRRAPSLEGQIIDTLNNGQQVQVLAISGEWTHVQVQDQKGYIFSQYLSTDDPNQATASSVGTENSTDEIEPSDDSGNTQPSDTTSDPSNEFPDEPANAASPAESSVTP